MRGTLRPNQARLTGLLLATLVACLAHPAQAQPLFEAGGTLTQREGTWGYRVNANAQVPDTGLALGGEWASDSSLSAYAGNARYRFGSDWFGIAPVVGWRGQVGGTTGPEVALGLDLAFSRLVPSLQADVGAVIGLDGQVLTQVRLLSRYRVLTFLDLQASYRLEQWASWTQVWGVGASLVL